MKVPWGSNNDSPEIPDQPGFMTSFPAIGKNCSARACLYAANFEQFPQTEDPLRATSSDKNPSSRLLQLDIAADDVPAPAPHDGQQSLVVVEVLVTVREEQVDETLAPADPSSPYEEDGARHAYGSPLTDAALSARSVARSKVISSVADGNPCDAATCSESREERREIRRPEEERRR